MKTVRIPLINKRFDDQYTLDLQGYLTVQDFHSTLHLFNDAVKKQPPPGNKGVWVGIFLGFWVLIGVFGYVLVWPYWKSSVYAWLILPALMMLTGSLALGWYRSIRRKFETSILETCSRVNASENFRGINYKFSKNGYDLVRADKSFAVRKSVYALVIEFDDGHRYHSDENFVSIPLDIIEAPTDAHIAENNVVEKDPTLIHANVWAEQPFQFHCDEKHTLRLYP